MVDLGYRYFGIDSDFENHNLQHLEEAADLMKQVEDSDF